MRCRAAARPRRAVGATRSCATSIGSGAGCALGPPLETARRESCASVVDCWPIPTRGSHADWDDARPVSDRGDAWRRPLDPYAESRMSLDVGTRLGPYEIVALLGAGGWARSTRRGTRASTAPSRSRSSRPRSVPTRNAAHASSARPARWPPSPIPTSAPSSTLVRRAHHTRPADRPSTTW